MKDIIPTVKIVNHAGVSSVKDGMKGNLYSQVRENKNLSGYVLQQIMQIKILN